MLRTESLKIDGVKLVEWDVWTDERGDFVRSYCKDDFVEAGLAPCEAQCSIATNRQRGTLRGLHFQIPPHGEIKFVRCIRGAIWDVVVDIRKDSPTYKQWVGVELSETNRHALYVPEGIAHGYMTLTDDAQVHYHVSMPYAPEFGRGIRWDDPDICIEWPMKPSLLSEKDAQLPSLSEFGSL